jgi:hypothetical protein
LEEIEYTGFPTAKARGLRISNCYSALGPSFSGSSITRFEGVADRGAGTFYGVEGGCRPIVRPDPVLVDLCGEVMLEFIDCFQLRDLLSVASMKKTTKSQTIPGNRRRRARTTKQDELRPHYDFDYSKSRPNRFASRLAGGTIAIVLDPDVAAVFQSGDAVNSFLRSAIAAMPPDTGKKRRAS